MDILTATSHLQQPGAYQPPSFQIVTAGTLREAAREACGQERLNATLSARD
jgi:hypothetical protein